MSPLIGICPYERRVLTHGTRDMLIYLFPLIASALAAYWDIPWHQTFVIG